MSLLLQASCFGPLGGLGGHSNRKGAQGLKCGAYIRTSHLTTHKGRPSFQSPLLRSLFGP
jgi:hypothetical protein